MPYVLSVHDKYTGLLFADTPDGNSYTYDRRKAYRFGPDIPMETQRNFARTVTALYNTLARPTRISP